MSRVACMLSMMLLTVVAVQAAHHPHRPAPAPNAAAPTVFKAGGLQFTIPADWQATTPATAARAGHWIMPPPADQPGDGVEIVVFFFGPGVGGSTQENIDAWAGTVVAPDGSRSKPAPQKRTVAGHAVTEVLLGGTYAQASLQPGLPPASKPNYALIGAVIESPAGNLYWRATGPVAQVMALAPVLDRAIDGLKPDTSAPGSTP
jgi:hypothetical protein